MSFVHSALFWGGIGLVSIPIIIHLITRRRFRRLDWAAMEFLLEALKRTRRRVRIEQLILLLCRIALVALIVAAVARPHLSQDEFGWLGSPFRSEEKIFVVDDSMSMAHSEAGQSALDRALEALVATVERVAGDGGRDPVTVIRTSRYKTPLVNGVTVDRERLESLRQSLLGGIVAGGATGGSRTIFPTALRMDLAAALEDLSTSTKEETGRAVYILTDLCRTDWTDGEGRPNEAITRALEELAGAAEKGVRVVVVDVGPSDRRNIAITDFSLATPNPIVGNTTELLLEVTNLGHETVRGVGTRLRTENSLTPGEPVPELAPGASERLKIVHTFNEAGHAWITAELDFAGGGNGLRADDSRTLVARVVDEIDVLVIDGEPSGTFGEGESDYLATALRPPGEVDSGLAPAIVVETNLPDDLERYGAVFLANTQSLPDELVSKLGAWVRDGGGLVIFPGDLVDGNIYASLFGEGTPEDPGVDVLPAAIGDAAGDPNRPLHVVPDFDHPAFRLYAGGGEELFALVDVARFRKLEPLPDARVVARLTDADESPFLVERQVGDGRVMLFAVPADQEWTSWPLNPSYPGTLIRIVDTISRPLGAGQTRFAGNPIELDIDLARLQREAILRAPDYPATPDRKLLAEAVTTKDPDANGEDAPTSFRFTIDDTRKAGVYELSLKTVTGEAETRRFAINPDPAESDLAAADATELAAAFDGIDFTIISDPAEALVGDQGRFEIADLLLFLFLALLFVEGTLAWIFAHHRRSAGAEPAAKPVASRIPGYVGAGGTGSAGSTTGGAR